jgi:hypothetical protein
VRVGGNSVTANVNASANTIEAAAMSRMAGHSVLPRALAADASASRQATRHGSTPATVELRTDSLSF